MHHIKYFAKPIFMTILILAILSCEEFVTVDLPQSHLTGSAVFEDENIATAALLDVYSLIREQGIFLGSGGGITFQLGIYSDELELFSSNLNHQEFYLHHLSPTNLTIENWWDVVYLQVYQLNALMEGLAVSESIPQIDKDQLRGEALYLRSLIFFNASNIWGDIPYITTTDYRINKHVKRDARDWVLEQIDRDLALAISILSEDYPSNERTRANRYTAMALQARIALQQEEWEKVEKIASEILDATNLYQWEENLDQIFKIESPSTIWQLQAGPIGRNTRETQSLIISSTPPTVAAMSESLYASFGADDQRLVKWIGSIKDESDGTTYYFPYKYQAPYIGDSSVEYSKVFRLAEIYLMRAEANANLGNTINAIADLNMIRQRAGLPALETISTDMIMESIMEERRHELFAEYGHRWFDLNRYGMAKEVLSPIKPGWKDTSLWFPIPEAELIANPNLRPQNNGY